MAWVKLDDGYPRNPKVLGLSTQAFRADITAICYCAEQDTDGLLPPAYLKTIPGRIREELLSTGRWDTTEDGVIVHDYLVYNPSTIERQTKTEAASHAARMRWASDEQSDGHAVSTRGRDGTKGLMLRGGGLGEGFAEFWSIYPRRVGKRAAEAAFHKAAGRSSVDEIVVGTRRYADDPNREPAFTAHPTTWLNRDGWQDDPCPPRNAGKARTVANILALADQTEDV